MISKIRKGKMFLPALATLFASQAMFSCKKALDPEVPASRTPAALVFNSNNTANSAVAGMYSTMSQSSTPVFNGVFTAFAGMSADEFTYTSTAKDSYNQFMANNLLTINNSDNYALWSNPYTIIYQANAIIEGLANAESKVSDSLKVQYTAEARFVRAFSHFYLTNMYGKVPLITTTNINVTATQARASVDEVYAKIIEDLTYAENNLAKDYKYSSTAGDRTRVNKWGAAAMLARVYLYRGDWTQAAKHASLVIDSAGLYSLVNISTSSPFYKNSAEAILQYYPLVTATNGTYEGTQFRPASATTTTVYNLRDTLLNSFETGDIRKTSWIMNYTPTGSAITYKVPLKYKNNSSTTSYTGGVLEQYTLLRLAEVYLIRAEALAYSNVAAGAIDLNKVRNRAGLGNVDPADQAALLKAVAHERQIELFAEFGHRWLDLKRTNTANALFSVLKPATWKATAVLYPVPEEASKSNPNLLPQNEGY
ncbi:RagB/SusD family nutrient uptake outer membrane protein [Filimonas lacunae]|uniref:RagB/SusD family nutrient uptake outer membrane protein n=1 Tax=Filimonas lacunae TaxID=477680 RepID=UPI0007D71F2B|nr:RagB/SusD family nutrient uptake outer membrane protein [Filimonas lacunae]BAV08922.1 outer membrane protein, nutrient binding [Filimonas lacunae]